MTVREALVRDKDAEIRERMNAEQRVIDFVVQTVENATDAPLDDHASLELQRTVRAMLRTVVEHAENATASRTTLGYLNACPSADSRP